MAIRFEYLKILAQHLQDPLVLMWGPRVRDEWHYICEYPPCLPTSIGVPTPVGLGMALALPHRLVVVIDTDGSLLINLGVLATLGNIRPPNLKVFVMDNECYESTGGQPSATAGRTDLAAMARAAGIENASTVRTLDEFKEIANRAIADYALYFVVIKCEKGTEKLPPVSLDGTERKYKFIRYVEETEGIHVITPGLQDIQEHKRREGKTYPYPGA